jgi:hypothetical protein
LAASGLNGWNVPLPLLLDEVGPGEPRATQPRSRERILPDSCDLVSIQLGAQVATQGLHGDQHVLSLFDPTDCDRAPACGPPNQHIAILPSALTIHAVTHKHTLAHIIHYNNF